MDPAIISATSAVCGSLVGGMASIATAWFTQQAQGRRERSTAEIRKRETVYAEFIAECSKLTIDAFDGTLESPAVLVQVYALQNRIRLTASDAVVSATDATIFLIIDQYFRPRTTMAELHASGPNRQSDPLRAFSEACRLELQQLQMRL